MDYYSYNNGNFSHELSDDYAIVDYPPLEGGIHSVKIAVETYVYPIFLFLGTILTPPLVVLLYKFSYTVWSSCFFLAMTLILDLVLLCVYCGDKWYLQVHKESLSLQIISMSNASCKVYTFLMSFIRYLSPWIMVVISGDVFISMNYPNRIYRMCTRERANATLLLIVVLLTFINLHYFWTFGLTEKSENFHRPRLCHLTYMDLSMEVFTQKIQPYMDFLLVIFIPFLVSSILLFLIFCFFCTHHQQKFDILQLKNYFLEVEALLEMRLLGLILCVWFVIVFLFKSVCQILFLKFQSSDTLDYATIEAIDLTNNLLYFSFLSCKSLLFYLLSAKIRRGLIEVVIGKYQTVVRHSQRYIIQQQPHILIQESEGMAETGVKISTDV
ncbi:uncharacterized protein LOC133172089 [Saccostrea echinata]|uniref:uncharacterized protein LOC133172089 n=1 Tax=Saccostrea echinata TaxID=191078 RepID=UPI002A820638|nr:uncharacterized protein LOC133172089 [Saccostrea echinata]